MSSTRSPSAIGSDARVGVTAIGVVLTALLVALSSGYGYHRDELYFLEASRHLALGFVDQGPLTPVFALVGGDSLMGLRVLPAVFAGLVVLVTGLIARDLGGSRGAQLLAAGCTAVSAIVLQTGHLLSTTTFDLLVWALVTWFVVRALPGGGPRWLLVGLAAGVGLQNKMLVAFLLVGLLVGLLATGPRRALRDPWLWAAGLLALLIWSPFLVWQATHGRPMLELSASIAAGGSTSSEPWWLIVPFQAVLVSPLLIPVWVAGLVALWRTRTYRLFPVAAAVLAVVFMATGGKPYYLCGFYPVLLAAGAGPTLRWAHTRVRAALLGAAVALGALVNVVLMLPVVPVGELAETPITAMVADVGETVGWPELAGTVAGVVAAQPPGTVVLAANYGEAGALRRFAPQLAVFSGHNSFADWGTPADPAGRTVVVGYLEAVVRGWFTACAPAAEIDNRVGLDNQEQGRTVWLCGPPQQTWAELWPQVRRVG
ncbi:glycosyltransferase family 39 protein [Pseudonocardia pini]|uniref:glycosyltransferase family 39 protein n=1 Tax=Pseudonocardia pini TaxID=2758030 RepID=UPI0015F06D5C|nr:glycosyltransferase family 39 protein [Pseudonocardia pini]